MEYKQIVISFEESQRSDAQSLCDMLEKEGVSVLMADNALIDCMTDLQLRSTVEGCIALVLLLSRSNHEMKSVERELLCAVDVQKLIIPIKLEDFELSCKVAPYLSNVQQIFAFENKREAMGRVVKQLRSMADRDGKNPYSLWEFLGKMLCFRTRRALKKADKRANSVKARINRIPFGKKTAFILQMLTAVATTVYIHMGITSTWRLTRMEINLITLVPLIIGILISFLTSLLAGRIKNKAIALLVSAILSAAVFVIMMLTGFTISQQLQ